MTVKDNKPEINLIITKAKVESILFSHDYNNEPYLQVEIKLMAGDKELVSMYLRSDFSEKNPRYIRLSDKLKDLMNTAFKEVKRQANLSLDNIQPTLTGDIQEAEIINQTEEEV
jgi:hypothetical protein